MLSFKWGLIEASHLPNKYNSEWAGMILIAQKCHIYQIKALEE